MFYLVKIEPRVVAFLPLTRSLAHWTLSGLRAITRGGAYIAASFSIGVRPCRAIEKRSWLYWCPQAASASWTASKS